MQEVLGFSMQNVSPSAEGEALRNDGFGACSVHGRSMLEFSPNVLATSVMSVCCWVDVGCGCSIMFCVGYKRSSACETGLGLLPPTCSGTIVQENYGALQDVINPQTHWEHQEAEAQAPIILYTDEPQSLLPSLLVGWDLYILRLMVPVLMLIAAYGILDGKCLLTIFLASELVMVRECWRRWSLASRLNTAMVLILGRTLPRMFRMLEYVGILKLHRLNQPPWHSHEQLVTCQHMMGYFGQLSVWFCIVI